MSFIKLEGIELEALRGGQEIDILVHLYAFDRPRMLVCEVKANGQPRHVRSAILQLRNYVAHVEGSATPIFVAPYLSPDSQALCREHDVGFMDLQGNAYITFDGVFIERLTGSAPPAERRELKSLFKAKAAHVLLVMLRDPERAWRVAELAEEADVSLGHVSNVRAALLDREWAQADSNGMFLAEPDALLDAWQDDYEPPAGKRLRFYTPLHGSSFDEAVRRLLRAGTDKAHALLASFSAANWLAPYARTGSHFFYADDLGLERLKEELRLSSTTKGENVVITLLKDDWLLTDTTEPTPGIICTSPVRTYLDLTAAGERGREAADHLRGEELKWQK